MSIYTVGDNNVNSGHITQNEIDIYGSSRLGVINVQKDLTLSNSSLKLGNLGTGYWDVFAKGRKSYELTNHLGNVFVTVSDKRIGIDNGTYDANGNKTANNLDGVIDYYVADVVSANDYYPFGMMMPGRQLSTSGYRYGFNSQEHSNELGKDLYTAQYWEYDARTGERWNVDPITNPYESPYAAFGNNPIINFDSNGKFKVPIHQRIVRDALISLGFRDGYDHLAIWTYQQSYDLFSATNDEVHFDNKFTSKDVYARWNKLTSEIHQAKLGDPNDEVNGVNNDAHLGKILHTVQDFYSHSNYVELYIEYYKKKNSFTPDVENIPTYDEGIQDAEFKKNYLDPRLKTGEFNVWRWLFGKDKKAANKNGEIHHDELNKDDASTPEGSKIETGGTLHDFAKKTALKHTKKILTEKKKELDESKL